MKKRILIANRGEIASRVIQTCRALGYETITIYSKFDCSLPYVRQGDFAVELEGESLEETYLNIDKIVEIAKKFRAHAIHPGYGLLSENGKFVKAVEDSGVVFVGPRAETAKLMGDKLEAKALAQKLGVPTVPGYNGKNQEPLHLFEEAKKVGFPLLVKAAAGGGGKGMKLVEEESSFLEQLESAKREAKNSFGDDRVLLEKYIQNPRHIEVQIVGDGKGKVLHFFERECSIQRRYQKIIEEAPAGFLDKKVREDLLKTAVKLGQGINYRGAGTVEYIYESGSFYFLEMNTRLQVEHPVSEMISGQDLVKLQLNVAFGEGISFSQDEIRESGHSFECRLYAEDPFTGFLPQSGKLEIFRFSHLAGTRIDNSYEEGNEVTPFYDPMIGKLISFGTNREEARKRMISLLESSQVSGIKTNLSYLIDILKSKSFSKEELSTHFIEKFSVSKKQMEDKLLAALFAASEFMDKRNESSKTIKKTPWDIVQGENYGY